MINQRVNGSSEAHRVNQNLELGNGNDNGKRTIRTDAAYALSWRELMKLMTEVYCPRNEIQKMETELWNLSVKNNDSLITLQQFQGTHHMCTKMVSARRKIRRPTRLQDLFDYNNLLDQKLKGYAVRNAEIRGRKLDNNYDTNRHYRKDCPKIKNQNRGDKARVPDARGRAYALGGGDVNPGSNTVTGTFLLNDHHAYMLFDSGADRSFVSNTFSTLLDITPYALDVSYAVELADGRTSETNTMLRGCTLGLLGHPFNIDLMPIKT
ncbi:reverse transcriptase domain-containing protein [Tanacetum coccineum]